MRETFAAPTWRHRASAHPVACRYVYPGRDVSRSYPLPKTPRKWRQHKNIKDSGPRSTPHPTWCGRNCRGALAARYRRSSFDWECEPVSPPSLVLEPSSQRAFEPRRLSIPPEAGEVASSASFCFFLDTRNFESHVPVPAAAATGTPKYTRTSLRVSGRAPRNTTQYASKMMPARASAWAPSRLRAM